ncbi:hypothetical protein VPH35_008861 [Triticum aestivum]
MVLIRSLLLDPALSTPLPSLIQWRPHDIDLPDGVKSQRQPQAPCGWGRFEVAPVETWTTSHCYKGSRGDIQLLRVRGLFSPLFTFAFILHAKNSGQPRGHRHFERGEILEVVIITDKGTGRSNGGGFEAEAAIRACLSPYPMISGRRATATSHASGPEVQGTTTNCLFSHMLGVRVERSRWLPFKHQQIGKFKL